MAVTGVYWGSLCLSWVISTPDRRCLRNVGLSFQLRKYRCTTANVETGQQPTLVLRLSARSERNAGSSIRSVVRSARHHGTKLTSVPCAPSLARAKFAVE